MKVFEDNRTFEEKATKLCAFLTYHICYFHNSHRKFSDNIMSAFAQFGFHERKVPSSFYLAKHNPIEVIEDNDRVVIDFRVTNTKKKCEVEFKCYPVNGLSWEILSKDFHHINENGLCIRYDFNDEENCNCFLITETTLRDALKK